MKGLLLYNESNCDSVRVLLEEFVKQTSSKKILYNTSKGPIDFDSLYNNIKLAIKEDKYDFIASWYDEKTLEALKPIGDLGLPVIIETGDCWSRLFNDRCKNLINKHAANIILVVNRCSMPAFKDYFKSDNLKFIWAPDGIDPNVMKDYNEERIYDVGFSGKFSSYIDRKLIDAFLNRLNERDIISYRRFERTPEWEDYARNLNRCWISYSSVQNNDNLYYKDIYIGNCFGKTLEIPGCNAALITRKFGDADIMGFKDGENCIMYEKINEFPKKLMYYLDNRESLLKLINKGYELVHREHTIENHMKRTVENISKVL